MNKKHLFAVLFSVFAMGLTACNGSSSPTNELPTAITVMVSNEEVTNINLTTEQSLQLKAEVLPEKSKQTVTWATNDQAIVSVSDTGLLTGITKGDAIITVSSTELTYISQQVFVHVSLPVVQTGVGSGKSPDDPIFLGNEGEDEPLEVYFLETYHIYSDSIYLKKGNVDVIIDAGYDYDGITNNAFIREKISDNRLDLLVASHSHGDHYDGIRSLISGIDDVSTVIDYGRTTGTPDYKRLVDELVAEGTEYYPALDCVKEENGAVKTFYLTSEFYVEILNTDNYIGENASSAGNPQSLTMMFNYRDFKFFTAGDLTTGSEESLLRMEDLPEVTLYKASHHGSHGSNSQPLLDKLNPKAIAITASRAAVYNAKPGPPAENATYNLNGASGHPAGAAVERMYKAPRIKENLNIYWNMPNGTMSFTTYGADDFIFAGSETLKGYHDLTLTNNVPVWNEVLQNFENKVTGEENFKLHETKVFEFRLQIIY